MMSLEGIDMEKSKDTASKSLLRRKALEMLKTIKIPEEHILGYYDKKLGHYVLPKEEDDEDDYDI